MSEAVVARKGSRSMGLQECEILWALADRVEREDPSADLYYQIAEATGDYRNDGGGYRTHKITGIQERSPFVSYPKWLESMDAADLLRPEGAEYSLSTLHGYAQVECPLNHEDCQGGTRNDGNVPMALCAGFLRARAAVKHAELTKAEGVASVSPAREAGRTPISGGNNT